MRILTHGVPGFDPAAVLLSMTLDDARAVADRVATTWSAEAVDGLDPQGLGVLTRALGEELPLLTTDRLSTLAAAIADSARALAAVRWRERGRKRPDTPTVDGSAVRGALLLHLHGRPDGPLSGALLEHHDEGLRFPGARRRGWRTAPTRERLERFAGALRAHEETLSTQLASLDD